MHFHLQEVLVAFMRTLLALGLGRSARVVEALGGWWSWVEAEIGAEGFKW